MLFSVCNVKFEQNVHNWHFARVSFNSCIVIMWKLILGQMSTCNYLWVIHGLCSRYRLQTVKSLAGVSLMLRLLWACLRWDDMAVKPSAAVGTTRTGRTSPPPPSQTIQPPPNKDVLHPGRMGKSYSNLSFVLRMEVIVLFWYISYGSNYLYVIYVLL